MRPGFVWDFWVPPIPMDYDNYPILDCQMDCIYIYIYYKHTPSNGILWGPLGYNHVFFIWTLYQTYIGGNLFQTIKLQRSGSTLIVSQRKGPIATVGSWIAGQWMIKGATYDSNYSSGWWFGTCYGMKYGLYIYMVGDILGMSSSQLTFTP